MARSTINDKVQTGIMLLIVGVLSYVGVATMQNTESSARVEEKINSINTSISDLKQALTDHAADNRESFGMLWKSVDRIRDKQVISD